MIIGFVGFMGSGKGTAGEILKDMNFHQESFANGVKDVASVMFGWPRHLLEGDTDESRQFRETPDKFWSDKMSRDFTPREALQKVGTEAGRDTFHKDFWVLSLENRIKFATDYVITDVRFPNEIDWIHEKGGIVIELKRGQNPIWYDDMANPESDIEFKRALMNTFGVHESEWAWVGSNTDATICNNGTKEDLRVNIKKVLTNRLESIIMNKLHHGENYEVI